MFTKTRITYWLRLVLIVLECSALVVSAGILTTVVQLIWQTNVVVWTQRVHLANHQQPLHQVISQIFTARNIITTGSFYSLLYESSLVGIFALCQTYRTAKKLSVLRRRNSELVVQTRQNEWFFHTL